MAQVLTQLVNDKKLIKGAVLAVCETLGGLTKVVGPIVKMVQNILIGIVSVSVAFYWTYANPENKGNYSYYIDDDKKKKICPSPLTLYDRFPKFVIGYVLLSIIFSFIVEPIDKNFAKEVYNFVLYILFLELQFIKILF